MSTPLGSIVISMHFRDWHWNAHMEQQKYTYPLLTGTKPITHSAPLPIHNKISESYDDCVHLTHIKIYITIISRWIPLAFDAVHTRARVAHHTNCLELCFIGFEFWCFRLTASEWAWERERKRDKDFCRSINVDLISEIEI